MLYVTLITRMSEYTPLKVKSSPYLSTFGCHGTVMLQNNMQHHVCFQKHAKNKKINQTSLMHLMTPLNTYHLPVDGVQPLDGSRIQLDGIRDISQDLVERVCGLLVEQDPDGLARLHSTADDSHQFGLDEVSAVFAFWANRFGTTKRGGVTGGHGHPGTNGPVGIYILCVVHLLIGLYGGTDVALA